MVVSVTSIAYSCASKNGNASAQLGTLSKNYQSTIDMRTLVTKVCHDHLAKRVTAFGRNLCRDSSQRLWSTRVEK